MAFLPFGEWLPDQPDYANPGAATIKNVIPLTAQSYGPMPTPQVFSGALTARCQGAYAFLDDSQGAHIFAGDATKLYQLTAGSSPNFSNISRSVGGAYSTGSPINPIVPLAPSWALTSFGKRIIATNYSDDVQTFLVGTDSNFSKLSSGAPKARFATTIKDFVMLGNTSDPTYGVNVRRLWWCGIGDPTNWPTPGSNTAIQVQSDFQDLEQSDLGQLTGLIGGHLSAADGAAFMEHGVYRIMYVGSSGGIFAFPVAEGAAGTQSPLSIIPCRLNGSTAVAAYLSENGFRAFDGVTSLAIGAQKVDQFFFADCDPAQLSMVQGGVVPKSHIVYWLYSANGGIGSGLYDRLLLFNTLIGRWSLCDLTNTPAEWGLRAISPGYTLDALDAFGVLDALPALLDSGFWAGGTPVLAAFDQNHKLNFLNGPAMAPIVETSETQPTPGRRSKILSARPMVDGGSPSVQIGVRDRLQDAVTWQSAVAMNSIGECPQLCTGRYVRARMTLPANSTFTHAQGIDLEVRPEGRQ